MAETGGRNAPEWVDGMLRNQRTGSTEMRSRLLIRDGNHRFGAMKTLAWSRLLGDSVLC
jgi:hypothetical protein